MELTQIHLENSVQRILGVKMETALSYSSSGKSLARIAEDIKILIERLENEMLTEIHSARTSVENKGTVLMNTMQGAVAADNIVGIYLLMEIQGEDLPQGCAGQFVDLVRNCVRISKSNEAVSRLVAPSSKSPYNSEYCCTF